MQRINTYDFYLLGSALKPVFDLREQDTLRDRYFALYGAARSLNSLLANEIIRIAYCRPAAEQLLSAIQELLSVRGQDTWEKALGSEVYTLKTAVSVFENNLAAELQQLDTYSVSKKGIYSTNDLIDRAEQALPTDVLLKLPTDAVTDFKQAGKCLAFEVTTASGFHMIRATETVIHKYYLAVTGNAQIKRKDRNWGSYVRNLNRHRQLNSASTADLKIIAMIDQIREHHRNVIIHPECTLTVSEAHVLFTVCIGAMVAMLRALP